jgi:hypothetical protein
MRITGTCVIEVGADTCRVLTEAEIRQLKNRLTDEFSTVLEAVLVREHGIANEQMHPCLVDELTVENTQ